MSGPWSGVRGRGLRVQRSGSMSWVGDQRVGIQGQGLRSGFKIRVSSPCLGSRIEGYGARPGIGIRGLGFGVGGRFGVESQGQWRSHKV